MSHCVPRGAAPFSAVSALIDPLYPAPVFYPGILVAVAGTAVLFAQALFIPLWWGFTSGPAFQAKPRLLAPSRRSPGTRPRAVTPWIRKSR